jgi:hypothetical protein
MANEARFIESRIAVTIGAAFSFCLPANATPKLPQLPFIT